jgi:hypothetical protein
MSLIRLRRASLLGHSIVSNHGIMGRRLTAIRWTSVHPRTQSSRDCSKSHTSVAKPCIAGKFAARLKPCPSYKILSVQWQQNRGISADRQRGIFGQIPRITFRRQDSWRRGFANPPKSAQKAQKTPLPMRWIVDIPAGVKSFVRWS